MTKLDVQLGSGRFLTWSAGEPLPVPRGKTFALVCVQSGRSTVGGLVVESGEVVVLEAPETHVVEARPATRKLILALPYQRVRRRYPDRFEAGASKFEHGASLVRDFMHSVLAISNTGEGVGESITSAAIELLGALPTRHPRIVERALAMIRAQAHDPELTAAIIADRIGMSRRRLDEVFAARGRTVSKEIRSQRLMSAATALRASGKIIDVALNAGFKDAAHFSRAFRSEFGMSPSAWKLT